MGAFSEIQKNVKEMPVLTAVLGTALALGLAAAFSKSEEQGVDAAKTGDLSFGEMRMDYDGKNAVVGVLVIPSVLLTGPVAAYIGLDAVIPLDKSDASNTKSICFLPAEENRVVVRPGQMKPVTVKVPVTSDQFQMLKFGGQATTKLKAAAWTAYAVSDGGGIKMTGSVARKDIEFGTGVPTVLFDSAHP